MKGYHVVRRFGWDTHGVPVEYEIDKRLGMSGRDAVQQMGIAKYNAECRSIVMRYATEWRDTIKRLGRWIDMDNDYKVIFSSYYFSAIRVLICLGNGFELYGDRMVGVQEAFRQGSGIQVISSNALFNCAMHTSKSYGGKTSRTNDARSCNSGGFSCRWAGSSQQHLTTCVYHHALDFAV